MGIDITEQSLGQLSAHAEVPISFLVEHIFDVSLVDRGLGGIRLTKMPVATPWMKDYDATDGPGSWARRFDTTNWGLIAAHAGRVRVAGAVIAFDTPGLHMLEGRQDLAVLWDLRVHPAHRTSGVGTVLFRAAEEWARARGCRTLKVETQNVNVPACRFYARMGCQLRSIDRFAYLDLPDEVQLLWSKRI